MAEVRILSHMNKDHRVSVEDYLVVYGKVKLDSKVQNIKMSEITVNHMSITFEHEDLEFPIEKVIPFEPPMEDLKEARSRLVEMAKYAAEKRGYSPYQIIGYTPPGIFNRALLGLIYLPLATIAVPGILTNSMVTNFLGRGTVSWLLKNAWNVTYITVGIHAAEALFIMKPKLDKFRVPTDYKLEWYLSTLLEGFPAIKRFNALVEEKTH
jgi:hypothetical protein